MFLIPCKFEQDRPVIFECVESIKKFYPEEKVVVIDSCSSVKEYTQTLNVFDVLYDNDGFEIGAYLKGFEKYPNEDYYFCVHDSLIWKSKLENPEDVKIIQYFNLYWDGDNSEQKKSILKSININEGKFGAFGTMFIATNEITKKVLDIFRNNPGLIAHDKKSSQDTERILGSILEYLGFDISKHSLAGHFTCDVIENDLIRKLFLKRG